MSAPYFIGVDVGTSSVRAGLISKDGKLVTTAAHPIDIFEPEPDFYEQSSENIWEACCKTIQSVCGGIKKDDIAALGFDGTCSMVVLSETWVPVTVSPTGNPHWNIIMWMDHRAESQASSINRSGHKVLANVGGTISLEMQTPKMLWLKQNLPESWKNAGHFFNLPDFLTWRSTGSLSRSLCSLTCKWTYQADAEGLRQWDDSFFRQVGLKDIVEEKYKKIGQDVKSPGSPCGGGLTPEAARELGLSPGTPVATSIIDAHAGGLGCLGCVPRGADDAFQNEDLTSRLALISGTSCCHMAISDRALMVPGVWGPYFSAMVPGTWLNEAGQSAAGKLIDHVVETHPAHGWIKAEADERSVHVHDILNEVLEFRAKAQDLSHFTFLSKDLHIWPDFHGNRSPVADSTLRGMVSGLSLSTGVGDLALMYLAVIQALAYGTRQILERLRSAGHNISVFCLCGGLARNPLYAQTHADVCNVPVILPDMTESMLMGSAILAACASGTFTNAREAMKSMSGEGTVTRPNSHVTQFHDKKYKVFLKMLEHQREYRAIMKD